MGSGSSRRAFLAGLGAAAAGGMASSGVAAQDAMNSDEWPEFGYDVANTGFKPDGLGVTESVGGDWLFETGDAIAASPAVAAGTVYLGSRDGNIYAINPRTGRERGDWRVSVGSAITATPAVGDGQVYVGDRSGTLHAIDAETGEVDWRFGTDDGIVAPPTVLDETVYVASLDGTIYAVEAGDGQAAGTERWSYDTGAAIESGPALTDLDGGDTRLLVVGTDAGELYGFDLSGGDVRGPTWRDDRFPGPVRSSPAIADGVVYVGSHGEQAVDGFVYALDVRDGSFEWEFDAGGAVVSSPVVGDGTVYVGSQSQELFAIDAETGEEVWRFGTDRPIRSSPALVDGTVYATSEGGEAYGIDLAGEERWSFDTGGTISASPAVAAGTVYVGNSRGELFALRAGGEIPSGGTGGAPDEQFDDDSPSEFAFLVVPAMIGGLFALLGAGAYLVFRSDWAQQFAVDEPPVEQLYDGEGAEGPDDHQRAESGLWAAMVDDVLQRADASETTATEDVIVTAAVDLETFEAPVVGYEIESARTGPARVTIEEPFVDGDRAAAELDEQPLNEGWRLADDALVFETRIDPGDTVKTMVGRRDCPPDERDRVLRKPDVTVEALAGTDETEPK